MFEEFRSFLFLYVYFIFEMLLCEQNINFAFI